MRRPRHAARFSACGDLPVRGGTLLSPIIFAVIADELNYGSSFLFIAGSAAVVAFLSVRYIPETRSVT